MRYLLACLILTCTTALAEEPVTTAPATAPIEGQRDRLSYAIGLDIGSNFKQQGIDLSPDLLLRGVLDALSGNPPQLTPEQIQETLLTFQQEMMIKQAQAMGKVGEQNAQQGDAFREQYAQGEGVVTTESGLMYRVNQPGEGVSPTASDTVTVHYEGKLVDGTVFDSSFQRGEPATFPLAQVIPGWVEGVQLMKPGSSYEFVLPPQLAYGERGAGERIGPNSTLIFKVELIRVEPAAATP